LDDPVRAHHPTEQNYAVAAIPAAEGLAPANQRTGTPRPSTSFRPGVNETRFTPGIDLGVGI
jgi:hypothetical protein